MTTKIMTAQELEDMGIPYGVEVIDAWDIDNRIASKDYRCTVMIVFEMDNKFWGTEIFDVWPGMDEVHWWSCHEAEDKIIVTEMQPEEVISIRYVPVPDITIDHGSE